MSWRQWIPFRATLRDLRDQYAGWLTVARGAGASPDMPRLFYGPAFNLTLGGGPVKLRRLAKVFPPVVPWNTIYTVGASVPPGICRWAARRAIPILLNADGVLYPACAAPARIRSCNHAIRTVHQRASHIFYQSDFSRRAYQALIGPPPCPSEILYNAVDTRFFTPAPAPPLAPGPVLLTAAYHRRFYRLEIPIRTLHLLKREFPEAILQIAGQIRADNEPPIMPRVQQLIAQLDLRDSVQFLPAYSQVDAPRLYQQAHICLRATWQDVCPNGVIEAMACGLPVVFSATGGVPELVGPAGIGVPGCENWEQEDPPAPEDLAAAVVKVFSNRQYYAQLARERAVERFDIHPWLARHGEVFSQLLQHHAGLG